MRREMKFLVALMMASQHALASILPVADKYRLRNLPRPDASQAQTALESLDDLNRVAQEGMGRHNNFKSNTGWAAYAAKMVVTYGEGNTEIVKNIPGVGGMTAVAAESARLMIEDLQRKAVENSDEAFQDLLDKHMSLYLAKNGEEKLKRVLKNAKSNPENALADLNETTGILNSSSYNKMDEKRKQSFQKLAIEKMAHDIAIQKIETTDDLAKLEQGLSHANQKAEAAISLNYEVYKATMSGMDKLLTANEKIFSKVEKFERKVDGYHKTNMNAHGKSHGFLDRMENHQFRNMSPEDQLRALKDEGWRPDLKAEDREMAIAELEVKVEIRANYRVITDGLSSMTEDLQNLSVIANVLGIDPKVGKVIGDAARIGAAALNAVTSFASGNVLGAVASVAGLFAKQTDVGAERHKQIMAAFGRVFENQQAMIKRLDQLASGQQQIMKNQIRIFEAISALSEQSHMQFVSLGNQLADIKNLVLVNHGMAMADNERFIKACFAFLPTKPGSSAITPLKAMEYADFYRHIQNRGHNFAPCQQGLTEMLPPRLKLRDINPHFLLTSYQYQGQAISDYVRTVHNPVMAYHVANASDGQSTAQGLSDVSRPFNPATVVQMANTLTFIHPYFQMLGDQPDNPVGALNTPQAISLSYLQTHGPVPRETGKEHLVSMLTIVDAAILQQKMLAGMGVHGLIRSDLRSSDQNKRVMAGNALANNSVLRRNLIIATIQENMKAKGIDRRAYVHFYGSSNPRTVNELLVGSDFEVIPGENGKWKVMMKLEYGYPGTQGGIRSKAEAVYLPIPDLIEKWEFEYPPELDSLVKMRTKVMHEILQYEIWDGKDDVVKKIFMDAI